MFSEAFGLGSSEFNTGLTSSDSFFDEFDSGLKEVPI